MMMKKLSYFFRNCKKMLYSQFLNLLSHRVHTARPVTVSVRVTMAARVIPSQENVTVLKASPVTSVKKVVHQVIIGYILG